MLSIGSNEKGYVSGRSGNQAKLAEMTNQHTAQVCIIAGHLNRHGGKIFLLTMNVDACQFKEVHYGKERIERGNKG
jgi:hypothetical protein